MLVFIYYWLVERAKYFLVSFCFFCSQTQKEKENAAKPQKNLRLGPKIIIIIFSFKIIFCQVFERTTNTTQAALQPPVVGGPHTLSSSRCRFLPVPPWADILPSPPPATRLRFTSENRQQSPGVGRYPAALCAARERWGRLGDPLRSHRYSGIITKHFRNTTSVSEEQLC